MKQQRLLAIAPRPVTEDDAAGIFARSLELWSPADRHPTWWRPCPGPAGCQNSVPGVVDSLLDLASGGEVDWAGRCVAEPEQPERSSRGPGDEHGD
jgi:hypothetical protein